MKVSVALAVYNGMPFLAEQLESITGQLQEGDELVVSDSGSTDGSLDLLTDLAKSRSEIKLYHCSHERPINACIAVALNFQNAVNKCTNDVVVLCDQDDVWLPGRLAFVRKAHSNKSVSCSVADGLVMSGSSPTKINLSDSKRCSPSAWANFYRLTVLGCQLSFRKSHIPHRLAIPLHKYITHDWWWYVNLCLSGPVIKSHEPLFFYRRHENNASLGLSRSADGFFLKVYKRVIFLKYMIWR